MKIYYNLCILTFLNFKLTYSYLSVGEKYPLDISSKQEYHQNVNSPMVSHFFSQKIYYEFWKNQRRFWTHWFAQGPPSLAYIPLNIHFTFY